jgi:8-oxo-dGTP pyrophosphatase MutT (NUDIX family)
MRNPIQVSARELFDLNAQIARDHAAKEYRPTAVSIVQRHPAGNILQEGETLFVRSAKSGDWGFPQGGIEEGEGLIEGLFRDLREETEIPSIVVASCRFCYRSRVTIPGMSRDGFTRGKSYYYFGLRCAGSPKVTLKLDEIDAAQWLSPSRAADFIHHLEKNNRQKSGDMLNALQIALCP